METAIINIGDFQRTRWIFQYELYAVADAWADGNDAEALMESLSERYSAGARIEDGPLSVGFETLQNGDRVLSLIEAACSENGTQFAQLK